MCLQRAIASLQSGTKALQLHAAASQVAIQSPQHVQSVNEIPVKACFETDATPEHLHEENREVELATWSEEHVSYLDLPLRPSSQLWVLGFGSDVSLHRGPL